VPTLLDRRTLITWANLITAARLLATVPCAYAIDRQLWLLAAVIFLLAVASDFADGFVARTRNETSVIGGTFDHLTDALFVSATLATLAGLGLTPLPLAPLVLIAFLQYFIDSKADEGKPLRGSRLGRWNGIAYFVIAGFAMLGGWTALAPLREAVWWLGWALVLTTILSMVERAWILIQLKRQQRTTPGSPSGGKAHRSGR